MDNSLRYIETAILSYRSKEAERAALLDMEAPPGVVRRITIDLADVRGYFEIIESDGELRTGVDYPDGDGYELLMPYNKFDSLHRNWRES